MAKWVFYVLVFVYMCYRAAYGARVATGISVDQINYGDEEFLEVGTRQTINCKASSRNQKLEWIDPFGKVVKRIPSTRVHSQEHFVSGTKGSRALALTLTDLLVSDSGVYQCKSGEQKKSVAICVIKPSEFVDTPLEVTIETGRSITLTCQAKGEPEPRLVWNRDGEEMAEDIHHPKYSVNRKYNSQGYESLLTIASLEPEDGGLYTCVSVQESPMLDNCTHSDSLNVTLHINHAPMFKNANATKFVYGKNNEVVDLKCKAKGWPEPTYKWYKDLGGDTLYEFDKTKMKIEEPNVAILSVTAGLTTFDNTYKCVASNSIGDAEKYFKLVERKKPRIASEVKPSFVTKTTVFFNVTWEDEIYFPIDGFDIQYIKTSKLPKRESEWKNADKTHQEIDLEDQDYGENGEPGVLVKLPDLEPATEYFVRMRATNEAGEAPWSDPVSATTFDEGAEEVEEHDEPIIESAVSIDIDNNSGMFYGIFFAGAILIVGVVCMFAMRLV